MMKRSALYGACAFLVAVLAACSAKNPYFDASKPHHAQEDFRNNYPHDPKGSFPVMKHGETRTIQDGEPNPLRLA